MTTIEFLQSPSAERQAAKEAGKMFTNTKIEETVGVLFITVGLFLTGWFYYNLYQALHEYVAF